jgi:hypothetical protein
MSRRIKIVLAVIAALILLAGTSPFFRAQISGLQHAGNWEDDPKNWRRAFNEDQPAEIKVIHSKYWRSSHFTVEFIYYFEVEATPEWRDAFLKKHGLNLVPPSTARSFRMNNGSDDIPKWFAPDPVELYDVWDNSGYGSVWINKTNGHIHFYDAQL